MKKIVIHTSESLIFRDGRPFGDPGNVDGGLLNWPLPATVSGMLRHRIGKARDSCFFDETDTKKRRNNIEQIKALCVHQVLPLWRPDFEGNWEYLYPSPADAVITSSGTDSSRLGIGGYNYQKADDSWGTDIPWHNWLIPVTTTIEKPPSRLPAFWKQDCFFKWLKGEAVGDSISFQDLGFEWPNVEARMHTAIDPDSYSGAKRKLFVSQGIRLQTPDMQSEIKKANGRFGIGAVIANPQEDDDPTGICFLGGDRRAAWVEDLNVSLPPCPKWFAHQSYLRIVLLTPGDFGHWAPDWLRPEFSLDETPWRKIPGSSDIEVRLVSAVLRRWQPMSGWDFDRKGPKATRKLAPAGSVYLVELKDPTRSQELAEQLWAAPLDPEFGGDGFGCVCVGKVNLT